MDDEPPTVDENNEITLVLDHGEASALSYFVAFSAWVHSEKGSKLTDHENRMITKVAQLDPDGYRMWQESVGRAIREATN